MPKFLYDIEFEDSSKDLLRALDEIKTGPRKAIISKAFTAAARPIVAMARVLAPKKTGKLRRYIKSRKLPVRQAGRKNVIRTITTGTREELGIKPDDPYYYPAAIEFGKKGEHAMPFMRPAFDQNLGNTTRIVTKTLTEGLQREWQKKKSK
jgi:HK97 gp10 family phage protein